jgi:hypothetical protein
MHQALLDGAVRMGLLEPIGVNSDGKTIYQRTTKRLRKRPSGSGGK